MLGVRPNNLPARVLPLVGRDRDAAEVRALALASALALGLWPAPRQQAAGATAGGRERSAMETATDSRPVPAVADRWYLEAAGVKMSGERDRWYLEQWPTGGSRPSLKVDRWYDE